MSMPLTLIPGHLTLSSMRAALSGPVRLEMRGEDLECAAASARIVAEVIGAGKTVYGDRKSVV